MPLERSKVAILGGAGFVGQSLSLYLQKIGCRHCLVDLIQPIQQASSPAFYVADITNFTQLKVMFEDFLPDIVIHLASWGMSGPAMLEDKCFWINCQGTQNVIDLCRLFNVKGLIYTSTYNVVFGGLEISNGDESMPYFPESDHSDRYAPSKAAAERSVLEANNSVTSNGSHLLTCSLRPAAIYGPGENRHFPRIVSSIDR
jgi:nucleoside-diphosphate-sugar epimerase